MQNPLENIKQIVLLPFKVHRNLINCLNIFIKFIDIFAEKFTIYAAITQTPTGFPRIMHEGFSFGRKTNSDQDLDKKVLWICTGSDINRLRCTAKIYTKVIDGYVMMYVKKREHTCVKREARSRKMSK